jgi:hypothetical protein
MTGAAEVVMSDWVRHERAARPVGADRRLPTRSTPGFGADRGSCLTELATQVGDGGLGVVPVDAEALADLLVAELVAH